MVSTPNYQLLQPDANDFVNVVTHLNDNYTKIDQDMNRYDIQIFTSAGTWTKPARCKRVIVRVQAGGASGGGCAATGAGQAAVSGGGGGGGYSEKLFLATALSATEAVTVGAGGTVALNNGNPGGASSFATGKAYEVKGNGGAGGIASPASAGPQEAIGGAGGTATGGDINITGGDGGVGLVLVGPATIKISYGGNSYMGSIASFTAGTIPSAGFTGHPYGGGSTGSAIGPSTAAQASTAGAAGIVVVFNYY